MDIFSTIKNLHLPANKYLVIGGAALAGRGIKETKDVDLLLSKDLLNEFRNSNSWLYHPRIIPTEEAGLVNSDGTVELYPTVGGINLPYEEIKAREEVIDGIPFANLMDILKIKQFYKRDKDLKDIVLIEEYLKLNP